MNAADPAVARSAPSGTGRRGIFLAFEGVEGSGKTTQVSLLGEFLRTHDIPFVIAREPGSTPLGERVRETVLLADDLSIPVRSELFLMLAARAAFVEQVVQPALAAGRVVIADRFELSTLAYQGAGRGLPVDEILRFSRFATDCTEPDLTMLLDLDPADGVLRQQQAGKRPDRFEREDPEFHLRVASGYRRLAGEIRGIVPIDANRQPNEVHQAVLDLLHVRFSETFPLPGVIR